MADWASPKHISPQIQYTECVTNGDGPNRVVQTGSAELFAQAQFALERELAVSANLRDFRKVLTGVFAVIIGIGFFRVDLHRSPEEVAAVGPAAIFVIRLAMTLALFPFSFGVYYLLTERSVFHELARRPRSGSSLSELHIPEEIMQHISELEYVQVLNLRTKTLRLAYERLVEANHRVRKRVYKGLYWLLCSLLLALASFVVYFWSI